MFSFLTDAQQLMERREQVGWRKHEKELKKHNNAKNTKNEDAFKIMAK